VAESGFGFPVTKEFVPVKLRVYVIVAPAVRVWVAEGVMPVNEAPPEVVPK
jgi:hypothetical protein